MGRSSGGVVCVSMIPKLLGGVACRRCVHSSRSMLPPLRSSCLGNGDGLGSQLPSSLSLLVLLWEHTWTGACFKAMQSPRASQVWFVGRRTMSG